MWLCGHEAAQEVRWGEGSRFVECIDQMHADGPVSSLLDFTKQWVETVNRGRLFDVSDNSRIYAIEDAMRVKEHSLDITDMIRLVVNACDVVYI